MFDANLSDRTIDIGLPARNCKTVPVCYDSKTNVIKTNLIKKVKAIALSIEYFLIYPLRDPLSPRIIQFSLPLNPVSVFI